MSIGQLVFWYALIIFVLVTVLAVTVIRYRAKNRPTSSPINWQFLSQWRLLLPSSKPQWLGGEFLLRLSLATFIALSVGVTIALVILPYGEILAAVALLAALAGLIFFLPKLLI